MEVKTDIKTKARITPFQGDLLRAIGTNGAKTRKELVQQLKVARTTIYDNLLKLQKIHLVEKIPGEPNGKRGRTLIYWKLKSRTEAYDN